MLEVVLNKFFRHEEDVGKWRGPSSFREELNHRREGEKVKGMLETTSESLLLAPRFGEVDKSLPEAGRACFGW